MAVKLQSRLLRFAGAFLFLYSIILTLAPATRARSWAVEYHWNHWLGFVVWGIIFTIVHISCRRNLPDSDAYILPVAALLTGWGILTIYRLVPSFGIRQTAWLLLSGILLVIGMRFPPDLHFLSRYKYIWLTGGLLLTSLTLIFGSDPSGGYEKAWLGCCGIYLQPSEPLKLLLIIFLAAYLADRLPLSLRPIALIAPTAVVMVVSLSLLFIQKDLGTASIFIFLYTVILYVASAKKRILLISLAFLIIAGLAGYFFFDVIRLRVDAWLNPWIDPSGRSFQIVQSLMAVANGGTLGRGPGLGSPGLVPVAISDFVFTAIAEETGLVGTLGLLILVGLLVARGIRISIRAQDNFRRILAAGLTAYLGTQSILIIGGNIRLLPLTGVTLPFVSYGGSSLVTSFLAVLILLLISSQPDDEPSPLGKPQPYLVLAGFIGLGLFALAATNAWWAVWRGPAILDRTDNVRRSISDRFIKRGSLLDRNGVPINTTVGDSGSLIRTYLFPDLAPITGYTHPVYGQSGLEASLDPYLRGLQGNPASSIWWDHLVYGQPPPGLNIRLTLDLDLQKSADTLLGHQTGAIVLINAHTGEILVMASHPTFDPNQLNSQAITLLQDPNSPLLDRAAQSLYPPGNALLPFFQTAGINTYPGLGAAEILYEMLGFRQTIDMLLPVAISTPAYTTLRVSPLQMVLAAATLSNAGILPAPRIVMAVNTPTQGWVVLAPLHQPTSVFPEKNVSTIARNLIVSGLPFWQWNSQAGQDDRTFTWSMGGTLPDWRGVPLAIVVLLEKTDLRRAAVINETLLKAATIP